MSNETHKAIADRPWLFRTYAGHSTASASNALYKANLAKGQTGLSVAFDLPTQTGYDADHELAKGEVGKVGVPISHLGDMRKLFEEIPLERMNSSLTINATAPWLLALYVAAAKEQGADISKLQGTVQNDLIKEYLSRGTYIFAPAPSMRLTGDVASWCRANMPKWNPMNVCSYHLQEAGATPEQELAFALATAISVLDNIRNSGAVSKEEFPQMVGRVSFFVNAGLRFVTEMCKMRAFTELWDEICAQRYGIEDPKMRRFRYGVQVNSLGLTEQQPENNVYRILIEMLAVTLSKNARARAVQLPAWNEALGLPRPFDQQWSLRMQQILAFETDLLEHDDLFDGNPVVDRKVEALKQAAREELAYIEELGGATEAIGYMKTKLVEANADRMRKIESGEQTVVGVNRFVEAEPSPLLGDDGAILTSDPSAEADQIERLQAWRAARNPAAVEVALDWLRMAARSKQNIMPPSIACAEAGVTTGEWAQVLRECFGEYRGPTGLETARSMPNELPREREELRARVQKIAAQLGRQPVMLVGKPGLDGHSNGAEQIAMRARDCGMKVIYEGIRLTAPQIAQAVREKTADIVGLSILSGSHDALMRQVLAEMKAQAVGDVPVIAGGIIPAEDAQALEEAGIARIYTPKDFDMDRIMSEMLDILEMRADSAAA